MKEIRDDEITMDAETGRVDGIKTTRTRYYTASRVIAYLSLLAFCISCWVGLIVGVLYSMGEPSCH